MCENVHNDYDKIVHIHRVLKPLHQATILLQRTDFTMSDFYATWSQLEHLLEKLVKKYQDGKLATSLLKCMAKRKEQLIENPAMLCALALDPRFCGDLTGERRSRAIDLLLNLWRRICAISGGDVVISDSSDSEMDISIQNMTMLKRFNRDEKKWNENPLSTNVFEISDKISHFMSYPMELFLIFGSIIGKSSPNYIIYRRSYMQYAPLKSLLKGRFRLCRMFFQFDVAV